MNLATYFAEPAFWLGLVAVATVYWLLDVRWPRARYALLVVVSGAVVLGTRLLSPMSLGVIVLAAVWMFAALRLTRGLHANHPIVSSLVATAPLLTLWIAGRFYRAETFTQFAAFVGISFLVVKGYSFAKDVVDGAVDSPGLVEAVAYLTYFPALPSGPMHTYGEFSETIERPTPPNAGEFVGAVYRLVFGLFKMKVLAPACLPFSLLRYDALVHVPLAKLPVACVGYAFLLYLDFSGTCDIVIAVSAALGVRVPENFRAPYLAPNPREFWQRWHATFTRALTGYIFNPLSRALQRRGWKPRAVMVVAYLATFAFCGFWHGATLGMLLWGLYHGVGLVVYDLVRQRRPKTRGKQVLKSPIYGALAVIATFSFVSIGWALFAIPILPAASTGVGVTSAAK